MSQKEMPINLSQGWAALLKELEVGEAPVKPNSNGELKLKSITTASVVFQPRDFGTDSGYRSRQHIQSLKDGILASKDHALEPIVVWWSGKCYRVLDGHHRLEAYRELKQSKKIKRDAIPVRIFDGDITDALAESVSLNSKDKLPMTKADKLESAWKMVCLDAGSKSLINKVTTISDGAIGNMRKAKAQFKESHGDGWEEEILNYTWEDMKAGKKPAEINDEYEEAQARKWAKELGKVFDTRPVKQPIIFARAIEIYSESLAKSLGEWWNPEEHEF